VKSCRAETSLASTLREHLARGDDDARVFLRQIFRSDADLTPDPGANTRTIGLHHLTQAGGSRSSHRRAACRPHRNPDGFSWQQVDDGLQNRISLISPGSGGLNASCILEDLSKGPGSVGAELPWQMRPTGAGR